MAEDAEAFEPHPQMLADALHSLLKPLKLTNGIRFKEQSTPVERVEFFHRQELCWIRIQEAPVPPPEPPIPNSVRIGGGFYIPEIRESAVEAAKAAAERVKRANSTVRRGSTANLDRAATIDGSGDQRLSVDGSPNRSQSVSDGTGSLSVNAGGRKLSKSGTMTLEREASLQQAERRISRSLTPTPDKVNSLTAGPVLLGAAAAAEKKAAAAGGATSGEDEEGEVWDPYNDDTESNVGGSSMNLGEYLEGEGEPREKRRVPSKFLHGEVQASTEDDRRGHGFHFGTFTRGSSRSRFGDRRGLHPGEKAEDFMGATTQSDCAFRVLTSARRRRSSLPVPRRGSKDLSASGPEPSCPGSEAMEALLAALGHDVVELDRLQVQRSECKVADKWKVELCYMYADCPTERVVEKQVEVMVEKKVQVPVEVPRPRPLSDDTGCQTTGIWCTYCGAPGHTRANCPLLALQKRVKELEDLLKGPRHEDCQLCGSDRHLAPYCPSLQKPPGSNVGVQTDPSCQLCARFGHFAPQCPLLAQLMQPKVEEKAARIRVGGGWLIAPQVPGLKEGGLNESDALELLASANTAGCLSKDGQVEYLGPPQSPGGSVSRPSSAPPARPAKPPTAPTSPRGRGRPSTQNASTSPRGDGQSSQSPHVAQTYAPKDPARVLSVGQMGPERFKQMEEERRNLSERISNGQGKAPSTGPRGFIIGTFVQGSHDRHRLSSDTGPRTMYRVYRSGIASDAAMDSETLEKRSNSRSNSRRSSLASVRSDSPCLGLPGELPLQEGGSSAASDEECGFGDHGCHGHDASPQIVIVPAGSATEAVRRFSHTSASSRSGSPSPDAPARSSSRHSTRSSP